MFSEATQAAMIKVVVSQDVLASYKQYIGNKDPLKTESFGGEGSRRDVVEMILFQQALAAGGFEGHVEFTGSPSYSRSFIEIKHGSAMATGSTVWDYDVRDDKDLWLSPSTVQPGDFVAGLYGTRKNVESFKKMKINEIKNLKVVTSKIWKSDHEALRAAGFVNILDSMQWELMIRMVGFGRADVVLSAFRPSVDLSFKDEGFELIPIPGYKINLQGGRVWAFSKKLPASEKVIKAFDRGVKILIAKGTIRKAYRESGFFNEKVKDWQVVK
ncbi:hypothetical protein NWE73_09955 [Bdellovibrio sp. PAP01]|uniref:Solute-binding protein family 3/N-terminal domain-containing protein n=1 Tax=Bdellovibrio svalbardensis TaxID=2972972 RepID=A0ABT6DIL8_9BACT|nr:hypothetical protein [Bdellovibrio svalbardensis]